MLTEGQKERYSRHIMLDNVGEAGQEKLQNGKVIIIGAGGLGSPIALYLAAAGVGTIGVADADTVDTVQPAAADRPSYRRHRQAKGRVRRGQDDGHEPGCTVRTYQNGSGAANIGEIMAEYDFVIDGTDNFAAKFLINDACVLAGNPYSHGGILQFDGQTMTVKPKESACYRCIFPTPPPKDAITHLLPCRSLRGAAGSDRHHPGDGSDQAHPRRGRPADGAAVDVQRTQDVLQGGADPKKPGMPGLRRKPDHHGTQR